MEDKISVIMGCYNCEKTLRKAIDSIIAQTYENWIMICCDDGSTDGTYGILNEYKEKYPDKFIVLKNEENKKLAYTLNKCLEYVETEFVARMDADDEALPQRFEKQLKFLKDHPELMVCGTRRFVFNEFSGREYVSQIELKPDKFTLHRGAPFFHPTIMCRREMYDVLGGYRDIKSTVRCEDRDLWFRFFAKGFEGENLDEPLYRMREDRALINRITPGSRLSRFKTDLRGYRLLKYPLSWYWKPVFHLAKILVPNPLVIMYYKFFRH